jgi:hypothetical protein
MAIERDRLNQHAESANNQLPAGPCTILISPLPWTENIDLGMPTTMIKAAKSAGTRTGLGKFLVISELCLPNCRNSNNRRRYSAPICEFGETGSRISDRRSENSRTGTTILSRTSLVSGPIETGRNTVPVVPGETPGRCQPLTSSDASNVERDNNGS